MLRAGSSFLLLLALVCAAVVFGERDRAYQARLDTMPAPVRAARLRYLNDRAAMPPDSVFWLGAAYAKGRAGWTLTASSSPARVREGIRLMQEAEARGSGRAMAEQAMGLLYLRKQKTAARARFVQAMQHGYAPAFHMATWEYAALTAPDGLLAHPDSLVRFYRTVRPFADTSVTRAVRFVLADIARKADAGRADARQMRADLQAQGLWDLDA